MPVSYTHLDVYKRQVVETNDTAYAVREPDEGAPLSRYLAGREEPLTQEEALVLLRPVVYGVDAMHRMGLLHRGISPDTIWITPQGAKLSGFATQGLRTAGGEIKCQLADGYADVYKRQRYGRGNPRAGRRLPVHVSKRALSPIVKQRYRRCGWQPQ